MEQVSVEVLTDVMDALENGSNFMQYIRDHDLQGTVRPNELRQQFVQTFGQEVLQGIMQNSMATRFRNNWTQMATKINDIDKIDTFISSMEDVITLLQSRKAELMSSSAS